MSDTTILLTRLFDYQQFERNSSLSRVISTVHERYSAKELSLDDLDLIAAAGSVGSGKTPARNDL